MRPSYLRAAISSPVLLLAFAGLASAQRTGLPAAEIIGWLTHSRSESIAGNSVDTGTGGFALEASVIEVEGGRTLGFTIAHDSITTPATIIGQPLLVGVGWTHNFAARIQGRAGGPVTVHWDDHRSNRFGYSGGSYRPLDESNRYDRLREVNGLVGCSDCVWEVTREDGTILQFDAQGVLKRAGNKIRQFLEVEKVNGRVVRVTEPISSRTINFTYGAGNRIKFIEDPAGRRAFFEYDDQARLAALHNPTSLSPNLLLPSVVVDIPDGGMLERTVAISNRPERAGVALLSAGISHSRPSDIRITLTSPAGTTLDVTPFATPQSGGLSLNDVVLSQFHGESASGQWRLTFRDAQTGVAGQLSGYNLRVSEPTYPTRFLYSTGGLLIQAVDSNGDQLFANVYDGAGRVSMQDDGRDDTPLATFAYQETAQGIVTTYTDRLGFQYVYEHDANYRLLRYTDPLGGETRYEHSSTGDRTAILDALGRRTRFEYDSEGNVTRIVDAAGNATAMTYTFGKNLSQVTDASGATTTFNYNDGNITAVTDAEGNRDTHQYGGNGQLDNVLLQDRAGMDLEYDRGQIVGANMIRGQALGGAKYDEIGLPSEVDDGLGNKIQLEYDGRGNVIRKTDPLGAVETMEYDARGRLMRKVDKNGNASRTVYDGNNNVVMTINALGETVQMTYDAGDRLVAITDPRGGVTERAYDAVGRMISETNPLGETVRREYDEIGNIVATYGADGVRLATIAYDQLDLPVSTTDALGNVTETRYDVMQRPVELIDPLGRSTKLTYDKLGRLIQFDDALGRSAKQEFLEDDVVGALVNGAGARDAFGYDDRNRIRSFTPSSGSVLELTWEYDERGLPEYEELPGGTRRTFTYDDAGRLTGLSYSGDGARPNRTYAYDDNGNVTTVREGGQTQLRRTFDALNRVTSFIDAHGDTIRYAYDENGNLSELTYPDGKVVGYHYDAANRLIEVVDWAGRSTTFGYDANSRLTAIVFPNRTSRTMAYDELGRLVSRRDLSLGGAPIVDYRYNYDALSLIREEVSTAGAPVAYQPAAMVFTYRGDGRFQTIDGMNATYDARGNLISLPWNGNLARLSYDADANLISGPAGSYEYDGEDRLIAWTTGSGRSRFTVNPHSSLDQLLVERSPGGQTKRYVYGGGLLYEETGNGIRVFHYDQRGSVVAVSGGNGTVAGTVAYGPYGEIIGRSGNSESVFQFCGLFGVLTDGSGLNYMRFRWYSPELKRFLTPDWHYGDVTDPVTLNRYAYAGNDPINFIDPGGEFLGALIGAVVGAVVNTVATVVTAAVTGQPLTAGDLIGAAVGGAITGGLLGACGPACAGAGAFLAASIGASAVGGAAGNALGQGIDIALGNQDSFDAGDFGVEIAASAVFGALPFGKGAKGVASAAKRGLGDGAEAALKRGSRASVSKLLRGGSAKGFGSIRRLSPKLGRPTKVPKVPTKLKHLEPNIRGEIADALFTDEAAYDIAFGVGQGVFVDAVSPDAPSPGSEGAVRDTLTVRQSGLREVNEGGRGVYGEYEAWNLYKAAHLLAGRALPNNPNPPLPQF
jgi:RHS repeat-associated protein